MELPGPCIVMGVECFLVVNSGEVSTLEVTSQILDERKHVNGMR